MTFAGRSLDIVVLGVSFLGTVALTPVARRLALRLGFVDRPAAHKFHRSPTPYLGGLAVAVVVLGFVAVDLIANPGLRTKILAFGVGGALVAGVGLLDDWRGLGITVRLAVQSIAAAVLWLGGIGLTPTHLRPVNLGLTILVVVLVTNSINLLDNMDGLAAGAVAIAAICCYAMAAWEGQRLIAPIAMAVAGACIGFLCYNFPPARIFLGDAGSLLLGFSLAAILVQINLHSDPLVTRVVARALVIGVPLFDTALVVASRRRAKRPVLRGGTDHLSHRLLRSGLTPRGTAVAIYLLSAASGALGLALVRSASGLATLSILFSLVVGVPILIRVLESPRLSPAKTSQIANTPGQRRDTLRGAG